VPRDHRDDTLVATALREAVERWPRIEAHGNVAAAAFFHQFAQSRVVQALLKVNVLNGPPASDRFADGMYPPNRIHYFLSISRILCTRVSNLLPGDAV
jgi:hypothetical protein